MTTLPTISRNATQGVELDYAEITSNFTREGAGESDVTGLEVTVTVSSRPIKVIVDFAGLQNSSASGLTVVNIEDADNTVLTTVTLYPGDAGIYPCHREVRLAPAPGTYTYNATLSQVITGDSVITAATTSPSFIQVIEI